MEQRNESSTAELIKNARYCCGDIECEGEKDCVDYCLDGRDDRNGDCRWCRQWLVHDLADRLEQLERENAELKSRAEQAELARDILCGTIRDMEEPKTAGSSTFTIERRRLPQEGEGK